MLASTSVRPKGFFLFRPKPKLAETAIFLFGRNRYRNRKEFFVSAETDTETETMISLKSAISLAQWFAQKQKNSFFGKKWRRKNEKLIFCGPNPCTGFDSTLVHASYMLSGSW